MWYNIYNKCCANVLNIFTPLAKNSREIILLQEYVNLFNNRFKYKNLPSKFLDISGKNKIFELMLFFSPAVAFFEDEALGLQCLPVTGQWKYNIAGFPTEWKVFGCNTTGYTKDLNEDNSVLMFNDYSFSIPYLHLIYNINYMVECDNTHEQNLHALRQPMIYEIDEDEKKSAEKFKQLLDNFSDSIKVRIRHTDNGKRGTQSTFNSYAYNSGRSFEGDKLSGDYQYFHSRNLTYLGYNATDMEKKERLLVDEINANNEVVNGFYNTAFEVRKESLEKVNAMFGTNIQIEKRYLNELKEKQNDSNSSLSVRKQTERFDNPLEE